MSEAIAALSLAANIVQFIDFASKVASSFWDFYRKSNTNQAIPNVSVINEDLQAILVDLRVEHASLKPNDGLATLTKECQKTAKILETTIKPLLAAQSRNNGKRASLKAAFSSVWKESEIQKMKEQVDEYRRQLVLHLLVSIRQATFLSKATCAHY